MAADLNKFLFSDQRFNLTPFWRLVFRAGVFVFYVIFSAATFGLAYFGFFSGASWAKYVSVLLLLFLLDRLYTLKFAEANIRELDSKIEGINVALYLEPKSFRILEKAYLKAKVSGGDFYLHLLKFLVKKGGVRAGLWRLDVSPEEFEQKINDDLRDSIKKSSAKEPVDKLLEKVAAVAKMAFLQAYVNAAAFIEPLDIFAALGNVGNESLNKIFYLFSVNPEDLEHALIFSRFRPKLWIFQWFRNLPSNLGGFVKKSPKIRHRVMNRAWTSRPTPILDQFSIDLTDLAREGQIGFLIGHEKEYSQLTDVLSRPDNKSVLFVGEPGSGREAVVSRFAYDITKDRVPERLFDKRVIELEISGLVSGADPKELSTRTRKIADEIIRAGNVILYIPDIHELVKTSGENFLSAADALIPAITKGAYSVIAATYPKEFKEAIEPRSDFKSAFEIVYVNELSEEEASKLLVYESVIMEKENKIIISFGAVKQSVILAHKYFRQKLLPSSAFDLLRESIANATQRRDKVLQADDVIAVAERKINVPIHRAGKEETEKLLKLEQSIHQRIIGQEEAVRVVSRALREYRSGLSRGKGPIAAFLFVGPTGVGKTELAKVLAETQFGSENTMLRFDMSEYQDKQSFFRFIGSPDGKIAGSLTESVIQKPYSLILLDEFEKAYPDVLNIFLQVFDDGRLTDNLGRTVDFTNTIIIATSNAHSDFIKKQLEEGKSISMISDEFKRKLTDYFKPELLNRFSDVIIFKSLSAEDILAITRLKLKDLGKQAETNQGVILDFDEKAVEEIARLGYDPVFGARPLRKVISREITSELAEKILKGEISKGSKLKGILDNGKIKFVPS